MAAFDLDFYDRLLGAEPRSVIALLRAERARSARSSSGDDEFVRIFLREMGWRQICAARENVTPAQHSSGISVITETESIQSRGILKRKADENCEFSLHEGLSSC